MAEDENKPQQQLTVGKIEFQKQNRPIIIGEAESPMTFERLVGQGVTKVMLDKTSMQGFMHEVNNWVQSHLSACTGLENKYKILEKAKTAALVGEELFNQLNRTLY